MKYILALSLYIFSVLYTFAGDSLNSEQLRKVKLLQQVEAYAQQQWGYSTLPWFYTSWQEPDSMTIYLYVSRNDTVAGIPGNPPYFFFGCRDSAAKARKLHYDSLGFHTMIYKTAGNSNCRLSSRLLSYPDEALVFIAFHELTHRHFLALGKKIPYHVEEALCDLMGNWGAFEFYMNSLPLTHDTDIIRLTVMQARSNESIYRCVEDLRLNPLRMSDSAVNCFNMRLNAFQQDRLLYTVNNAYLLRYYYYFSNYFILKDIYSYPVATKKFIKKMNRIPADPLKARKYLAKLAYKDDVPLIPKPFIPAFLSN